jgi:hypothetical protein
MMLGRSLDNASCEKRHTRVSVFFNVLQSVSQHNILTLSFQLFISAMSPSLPQDMGGLSHLVEAATALTELLRRPVPSSFPEEPMRSNYPNTAASIILAEDDSIGSRNNIKKKEIFPQKLIEILADKSLSDIVSWLPHGRSFVIIRPDRFCEQVLPLYLPPVDSRGSTKYPSFTRKLNRW